MPEKRKISPKMKGDHMQNHVLLVSAKEYNDLTVRLSSLEDVRKDYQFDDTEHRKADSILVGESRFDLPMGLEAYADAIQSLERTAHIGVSVIKRVIEYALRAGFKIGVEYADEVRTRQMWIR